MYNALLREKQRVLNISSVSAKRENEILRLYSIVTLATEK